MEQNWKWGLLRKRNILGAVLVAGIVAGVYLSDFLKGLGFGLGPAATSSTPRSNSATTSKSTDSTPDSPTEDIATTSGESPAVVRVVITNRSYSLRTADGDRPVDLSRIVELAKAAKGDDDGIRVRIYRKLSSRAQAETDLENALTTAGISDKAVVFMPTPVED